MPAGEKKCIVAGCGMGTGSDMTGVVREALLAASVITGSRRLLRSISTFVTAPLIEAVDPEAVCAALETAAAASQGCPCAVVSGDCGFYSGAARLLPVLEQHGWQVSLLPGISTVQAFAARIRCSWQKWNLVSAHGTAINLGARLSENAETFFLTGGMVTPHSIIAYLNDHGAEDAIVTVAARLGAADEYLVRTTAGQAAALPDIPETLAVILVERSFPAVAAGTGALPDEFYIRNDTSAKTVPMTKQFIRSAILSLLSVRDGETVWDIGAGTGAVSIDIARCAHCMVYAVEENTEAVRLEQMNRKKAGTINCEIITGRAPEALLSLPPPDAVFIGGADGELNEVIDLIREKNPAVRIVVSAVTVETFAAVINKAGASGLAASVVQVSVSQSHELGRYHLMTAQNPVWLVSLR
jgi:precorrin-6B C5,15-methyltransferase / cobalt-precorrin-6B C5,C15-methyltransferase